MLQQQPGVHDLRSGDQIQELLAAFDACEGSLDDVSRRLDNARTLSIKRDGVIDLGVLDTFVNKHVFSDISLTKVYADYILTLKSLDLGGEPVRILNILNSEEAGRIATTRALVARGIICQYGIAKVLGEVVAKKDSSGTHGWLAGFFDGTRWWNGRHFQDFRVAFKDPETGEVREVLVAIVEMGQEINKGDE